ncbi:hypothetical protein MRX96_034564 [Rhipicephalus microplus]
MAGYAQECSVSALKRRVFAVATDGSNDSQAQLYPIVATFFAEESGLIESKLLTLSTLEGTSTGRNIAKLNFTHHRKTALDEASTHEDFCRWLRSRGAVGAQEMRHTAAFVLQRWFRKRRKLRQLAIVEADNPASPGMFVLMRCLTL